MSDDSIIAEYHAECMRKGTYLVDPTEKLTWFPVGATNASYLIRASDTPLPTTPPGFDDPPPPVELMMICRVCFPFFLLLILTSIY